MISDRKRKGGQDRQTDKEGEELTKAHGFEEVFNLVYFLPAQQQKGTVSIPLHPSLPGRQLIAALQEEKGRAGERQADNQRKKMLKQCGV